MRLNNLTPMLEVTDMEETIGFYHDLLGFECTNRVDGWALLLNFGVEIMICLPNAHTPFDKPCFTGSLYMKLDDVDVLWQRIKDKTTVVYPLENFFYGMREFAIRDNNGYCLQFASEIKDRSQIRAREQD